MKNLYCYDRSLGHYWALRRELTNREWLEIDARKKNGERLSDILAELRRFAQISDLTKAVRLKGGLGFPLEIQPQV